MMRHTDRNHQPQASYGDKMIKPTRKKCVLGNPLYVSQDKILEKRAGEYYEVTVDNPYIKQYYG